MTWTVKDGQNNKTTYEYDGFDRLAKTRYPETGAGTGNSSTTDYEELFYDANSNVVSRRGRDGLTTGMSYDALNRLTFKDFASTGNSTDSDITYTYDLLGRLKNAADGNAHHLGYDYDALGRPVVQYNSWTNRYYQYDQAGRLTALSWQDGLYVNYDHLVTGEVTAIRENNATTGPGVLATYAYDDLGRRTGITRGNGTTTSYGYDGASRLTSLGQDLAGTSYDLALGFSYNAAGQIASTTRSNDAYGGGASNLTHGYSINGLNQVSAVDAASVGYDTRGNLTSTGSTTFHYNQKNQLDTTASASFFYNPVGDLDVIWNSTGATLLEHQNGQIDTEMNASAAILRRYVPGPNGDEPVVWYEGSGTSDRRWLHADERGSVIAVTNGSGAVIGINTYDEYGVPGSGNIGRFQHTGQTWLPEIGLYYYKARIYSSRLGRFMQTDPIDYGDGLNWYNYVGGGAVNFTDPFGLFCANGDSGGSASDCAGKGGWVKDTPYDRPPEHEILAAVGMATAVASLCRAW